MRNSEKDLRDFLSNFSTTLERSDGDSGFFLDPIKKVLVFFRDGKWTDSIEISRLEGDPCGAFNDWRRSFKRTQGWEIRRERDKDRQ